MVGNLQLVMILIVPYLRKGFESLNPSIEINQVLVAHFLAHFINKYTTNNKDNILPKCQLFDQQSFANIYNYLEELQLDIPNNIDGRVYQSIKNNKLVKCITEKEADELRNHLFEFGEKIMAIQHFCFHNKFINLSKLLGKLLTRIWWIYHMSSPIMKPFNQFDDQEYEIVSEENNDEDNDNNNNNE